MSKDTAGGGFKWKDGASKKAAPSTAVGVGGKEERRKERSPVRDDVASKFGSDYQDRYTSRAPAAAAGDASVNAKFGSGADGGKGGEEEDEEKRRKREKKERKRREKEIKGPKPTDEPMIIVNVNDRLGTKAQIPCLASDSISAYPLDPSDCDHLKRLWHVLTFGSRAFQSIVCPANWERTA